MSLCLIEMEEVRKGLVQSGCLVGWKKGDDEERRLFLRWIIHVYFDINFIKTLRTNKRFDG